MTLRSRIIFLPKDMPLLKMLDKLSEMDYNRIPVYDEYKDNIVGILHARDLLNEDVEQLLINPDKLEKLLRKPWIVPESLLAIQLFNSFRKRKQSFALTADEYGGITGLVTMTDMFRCIFGEISFPEGSHKNYVKNLGEGMYHIDARISIEKFNDEMGCHLSNKRAKTIGGFLLHEFGEIPGKDIIIISNNLQFTVIESDVNRINTVLCKITSSDNDDLKGE